MKKVMREIANSHAKLRRSMVWCLKCGKQLKVNAVNCLANGWPVCCGEIMTIDDPEVRRPQKEQA